MYTLLYILENIEKKNKSNKKNILICSLDDKQKLLKEMSMYGIVNLKIYLLSEFEDKFFETKNCLLLYEIYKQEKNYYFAKEIYANLYNDNLDSINGEKTSNILNKLVKYRTMFLKNKEIKNKQIDNLKNYNIHTLDVSLKHLNINYKELFKLKKEKTVDVLEFSSVEEEIVHLFMRLEREIISGRQSKNLKIIAPKEYFNYIYTLSKYWNINIVSNTNTKFYSNNNVHEYIDNIYSIKKLIRDINLLSSEDTTVDTDTYLSKKNINEIVKALNEFVKIRDEKEFLLFLKSYLKDKMIKNEIKKEGIKLITIEEFTQINTEKIYVVGFNNYNFVKYKKDNDFLTDVEKQMLKLKTAIDENNQKENKIKYLLEYLDNIKTNDEILISYSKNFEQIEVDYLNTVTGVIVNNIIEKENKSNNLKLDYYLNLKNNEKKDTYNILNRGKIFEKNQHINNLDYKYLEFQNNYKISATSLNTHNQCHYRFYLEKILNLKRYTDNYKLKTGNYIHKMLEKIVNEKLSKEKLVDNEINDYVEEKINQYTNEAFEDAKYDLDDLKDIFYTNKINKYLKYLITHIKRQIDREEFKIKNVELSLETKYKDFVLTGNIDVVLCDNNNNYMVIDYKSKEDTLNLTDETLNRGDNLQNMIYFILLFANDKKIKFGGTYRYRITPELSIKSKESTRKGYTNKNIDVIQKIDIDNYADLKINKDGGLSKQSKVLSEEDFLKKIDIVNEKLDKFVEELQKGDITVTPFKLQGCSYCLYNDICYKRRKDIKNKE